MRPDILLIEPLLPEIERRLDDAYVVHRLSVAADRTAFLAEVGPLIRAVVTGGATGLSRRDMDALPVLGVVAINGVGTDSVDLARARERGIRVTNTPDVLTDDVADLAIALVLAASRQLLAADRYVREGRWARREALPLARKATGKRLGILGMGRIGRAVARRAEGFDMPVSYHNRNPSPDVPYAYATSPLALAEGCDILVVAASGGPDSRGLVDRAVMDALGPSGILVNVARGTVVDEAALVAALSDGTLGGAGLDVFEDEPNVPADLVAAGHVVLQPHRASATVETRITMGQLVLDNLAAFFAGREIVTAVV